MVQNAFYFRLRFNIEGGQMKQMVNREAVTPRQLRGGENTTGTGCLCKFGNE